MRPPGLGISARAFRGTSGKSVCGFNWQPERFWSQPYCFVLINKWASSLQRLISVQM